MNKPMNLKQRLVVIVMDLLLLAELAVAIYLGYQNQEQLTLIFLRTYVPAMAVTVVLARICFVRFRSAEGQET